MAEAPTFRQLPIEGCKVSRLIIDYRFGLGFYEGPAKSDFALSISTEFTCRTRSRVERHDPEDGPDSLGAAYSLLHSTCEHALAYEDGRLSCAFDNGVHVEVLPDERYEAWELAELKPQPSLRIIALPGGGLAVWEGQDQQ